MKLDKLTPKQQEILDKLCKDSLEEILHTVKTVKYEDIKDDVDWLYKLSGVNQKPIILIFDSWLESQVAANYCAIINLMVSGELNQVQSQVRNQVLNQVENQKLVWFGHYYYLGLFWSSWWLTYYEYFRKIKVIENKAFERWCGFLFRGIFDIIIIENFIIITRTPKKVKLNNRGLHSLSEPAFQFQNNDCYCFIDGVFFPKELWQQVKDRSLTIKQVLSIPNIEQRRVVINCYGYDVIFDELDSKLINKSKRKSSFAELYRVKGLAENIEINLVRYKDPSTNRCYVSQVPDEDDLGKPILTADHAMALESWMSLEEYNQLEVEA